jgi:hypothetical protein
MRGFLLMVGVALFVACASSGGTPATQQGGAAGAGETSAADPNAIPPEKLDEVQNVFRDKASALNGCYRDEVERTKNTNLSTSVTVKVTILASGEVKSADVAQQENASNEFQGCVVQSVGKFVFPALPAALETSWPYQFKPNY